MAIGIGTAVAVGIGATIGAVRGFTEEDSPWREVGDQFQKTTFGSPNAVGTMTEGAMKGTAGMVSYHAPRRGPIQGPGIPKNSMFGQRTSMSARQPVSGRMVQGMYNRRRG